MADKSSLTYKDFLRQQALDELAQLNQKAPLYQQVLQGSQDNSKQSQQTPAILSQDGPITENYGDIQPGVEVFSGGFTNGTGVGVPEGTDLALPPGKWGVIDSYNTDPYQGYIGDGTNSGYGNSVFVQNLSTGEKLRLSHLAANNAAPGSILDGGTVIGKTGATGNVTGPHLNVEYYDPKGNLGDFMQSAYSRYLFGNNSGNDKSSK